MTTENTIQRMHPTGKQPVARERTRPGLVFRPEVDIIEQKDAFLVTADLPGVDEHGVEVRLEHGQLSIDAAEPAPDSPGGTLLHAEYRTGGYHREFELSDAIDVDAIEARMTDGVLELRLPKRSQARPRQISIQGG